MAHKHTSLFQKLHICESKLLDKIVSYLPAKIQAYVNKGIILFTRYNKSVGKKIVNTILIVLVLTNFGIKFTGFQPKVSEDAGIACAPGETIPVETANLDDVKFVDTEVHDREWKLQQVYIFCFQYKKILTDVMKSYTTSSIN